jgi:hypothetical protein
MGSDAASSAQSNRTGERCGAGVTLGAVSSAEDGDVSILALISSSFRVWVLPFLVVSCVGKLVLVPAHSQTTGMATGGFSLVPVSLWVAKTGGTGAFRSFLGSELCFWARELLLGVVVTVSDVRKAF